jgi:hypothetical protein
MSRSMFRVLLSKLERVMRCDVEMARRSSGCAITPCVRLAIALQMLAGASYVDIYFAFKVSQRAAYYNTHCIVDWINKSFALLGIPLRDENKLADIARLFTRSRGSPLFGRIAALDGILIPIKEPPDHLSPRNYFCRKGYYALPLQVVCDFSSKFLFMSGRAAGATTTRLTFQ